MCERVAPSHSSLSSSLTDAGVQVFSQHSDSAELAMPALDDILGPGKSLSEYFKRYDFDENGTLSSAEGAQQLTLNLIFAIETGGHRDELLEDQRKQATALVNAQNWEPDSQPPKDEKWYSEWFEKTFLKHPEPSPEHLQLQMRVATRMRPAGSTVKRLLAEKGKQYERLFERYDLDLSGCINSRDEANQLTTNIACNAGLSIRQGIVEAAVSAQDWHSEPKTMDDYIEWFEQTFMEENNLTVDGAAVAEEEVQSMPLMLPPPCPHWWWNGW